MLAGNQGNATFSRPIEATVLSETLTFFKSELCSVGDTQVWLIFNLLESQSSVVKLECLCVCEFVCTADSFAVLAACVIIQKVVFVPITATVGEFVTLLV